MSDINELMLTAAYEALLVTDANLRVTAYNQAAATFLGHADPTGMSLPSLLHSSELDGMFRYIVENRERDFEVQTKIDERFYRVRTRLHYKTDEDISIGIAFQDVTEMVRLNRARRDMVANISHELRNPVAKIRLIIDSLFHDADKPKRKKSIQSLRDIARETDSLQWIVQEMLDLSMIESGQSIVRMVDVPLTEMVTEAVERMTEQASNYDMVVTMDVPGGLTTLCDRDLARRVIINLLHNSIKYSPEGTEIGVVAQDNGEYVTVSVYDEGPGIPAKQTERIFERFYQVDSSRTKTEGTGLGLSICKHIIEAHGGRIWAIPAEKAGGGRFAFTLLNANHNHDTD